MYDDETVILQLRDSDLILLVSGWAISAMEKEKMTSGCENSGSKVQVNHSPSSRRLTYLIRSLTVFKNIRTWSSNGCQS